MSDRQLRAGMKIESGHSRPHRPDAIVAMNEQKIALEVELSVKSAARLATLMRELAASEAYVKVWYFTNARSIHAVSQAIASLAEPEQAKFVVYNLDDMPLIGAEDIHEAPTTPNA